MPQDAPKWDAKHSAYGERFLTELGRALFHHVDLPEDVVREDIADQMRAEPRVRVTPSEDGYTLDVGWRTEDGVVDVSLTVASGHIDVWETDPDCHRATFYPFKEMAAERREGEAETPDGGP